MKKSILIVLCCITLSITNVVASQFDPILDKLVEKGILTTTDSQEVRNEANTILTKEVKENETVINNAVKKALPKVTVSGYTQFYYSADPTLGGLEPFGVKRARVAFNCKLNDWATFKMQPDFDGIASPTGTTTISGKTVVTSVPTVAFKEVWADITPIKDLVTLRIGQYHQPFGFELPYSSSRKKVFDTPQYMSKVITSDYDYGIQWWGNLPRDGLKDFLQWKLAILNGTTTGTETNGKKDFAVKLSTKPVKEVELSLSCYERYIDSENKYETSYNLYSKIEDDSLLPGLFFTLEYVGGKDSTAKKEIMNLILTLECKPFSFISSDLSFIAPVIRLERWDPDMWKGKDEIHYYTVGCNFYFDKSVRLLIDYLVKDDNIPDNNRFNAMLQLNY